MPRAILTPYWFKPGYDPDRDPILKVLDALIALGQKVKGKR